MRELTKIFILIMFAFGVAHAEEELTLTDGEIIGIYNQVNSFDIESALLAVTRSENIQVINLATQVANDHRGVRLTASTLADSINLEVSIPNIRQAAAYVHFQKMVELSSLEGEEFERAYLLHEIDFHTNAITAMETILIPSSSHSQIIEHFKAVLPHFKHHLSESKNVARELGYH